MKTIYLVLSIVLLGLGTSIAQVAKTRPATAAARDIDSNFSIRERGPHHRLWSSVTWSTDARGRSVAQTNSFVELATGLNFVNDKGEWEESKEEIEILSNGKGAAASKGQHKVIFPPDVYEGQIEMSLPDGKWMMSRVLGLAYFDAATGKSVLIAENTNSIGELHGRNVVIYPNAFTDIEADLRYTYTREGFEQDVILRGVPPIPEDFGLDHRTTRLQVLTEFFNPPIPAREERKIASRSGGELPDDNLTFGEMKMGAGKAFSQEIQGEDEAVPVGKQWLKMEGRDFLIEEVQFRDVLPMLDKLPKPDGAGLVPKSNSGKRLASLKRKLPAPPRLAENGVKTKTIKQAMLSRPSSGLVLDYVTINTSLTNYTFQGDTTYYLSGNVSLNGTNSTFEGGTVLKYTNNVVLTVNTPVTWLGDSYRPVLLISKDDNTAGQNISGSSGNPGTSLYAANALYFDGAAANTNLVIQNLRVANATRALSINTKSGHIVKNLQLVNCANGLSLTNAEVSLRNALMFQVTTNFTGSSSTGRVEHLTSDIASWFNQNLGTNLFVTNSLLVLVTNTGSFISVTNSTNSAVSGVFQTVGAASHYLAASSTNRNVGSTNINSGLLADLKKLTTYPPIESTKDFAVDTVLSPQALRDTDVPDLGFHYDPLDYVVNGRVVTNSTLILTNGVVLGAYGTSSTWGVNIGNAGNLVSEGSAAALNQIVAYNTSQEQANSNWVCTNSVRSVTASASNGKGSFRFTRWSILAGKGSHFSANYPGITTAISFKDCQFGPDVFEAYQCSIAFTNCLMERPNLNWDDDGGNFGYTAFNNLFYQGTVAFNKNGGTAWSFKDNLFDRSTNSSTSSITHDYNSYVTNYTRLSPNGANDKILTNSPIYQTSFLGRFYYPTNGGLLSNLINAGSRNATNATLYHYTVTTNQVKEANSTVDIGFHYVATNTNGVPIDTDSDGRSDYLEDTNGNGFFDGSETDWNTYNSPNGFTSGAGLQVFTPLK